MRAHSGRGARVLLTVAFLWMLLLLLPAHALASRTLGLSAGSFKFSLSAGQEATGSVDVINDGTEPLKVMVYAADQIVSDRGSITYKAPSQSDLMEARQPATWTTIRMPQGSKALGNVPYLELKPKQRIPIKFSITVPDGVAPGDHNLVIFFESFETPPPGSGAKSMVIGRLGTRVTLRVAGPIIRKLEVRPYNVPDYVLDTKIPYDFTVRNSGNVDQRVGARVMLLDRSGNEVGHRIAIDGVTVFAASNLEASGTVGVSGFPVGPFKARLDVSPVDDAGRALENGAQTITQIHDVWVIPVWLIIVAVVIVVVLFVGIIWAIAARATRRKDVS